MLFKKFMWDNSGKGLRQGLKDINYLKLRNEFDKLTGSLNVKLKKESGQ